MDTRIPDGDVIEARLLPYLEVTYAHGHIQNECIINRERTQFVVISHGWDGPRRIHTCLLHISVVDEVIWIHRDGTEHGFANELVQAGIPARRIVLGFQPPSVRRYSGFAPVESAGHA